MKTRYRAVGVVAVISLVATIGAAAIGQTSQPISVQIGAGTELSSSAKNAVSSTSIHAGVALAFSDTTTLFALPGSEGIDLDYNHASGHGGHFDAYGATYTNRISLLPKVAQPLTAHVVPYVGFGVGLFEDNVSKKVTTTNALFRLRSDLTSSTTTTQSGTKTNLGGKLLVGVDMPSGVFVEASYIISGSSEGVRTDSVDLAVGMRL